MGGVSSNDGRDSSGSWFSFSSDSYPIEDGLDRVQSWERSCALHNSKMGDGCLLEINRVATKGRQGWRIGMKWNCLVKSFLKCIRGGEYFIIWDSTLLVLGGGWATGSYVVNLPTLRAQLKSF